ncbi:MAG: hypothetical protein EA351_13505 [Gemmatimonadales bacterium]|nr:MAG: hypothetical protein EA351_13505 [Gemmatimonadales bacterium]
MPDGSSGCLCRIETTHEAERMRVATRWALILLIKAVVPAAAQHRVPEPRLSCDAVSTGGAIQGVLLNDSTGLPLPRRGVHLVESTRCMAVTDSLGRFEIERVPSGQHRLGVGSLGHRRFAPVEVEMRADSVVELTLRLRPENLAADCLEIERCASLLRPAPALVADLTESERLEEAAWRTSIALAGQRSDSDWVPCVDVGSERVRQVLERRIPSLASATECGLSEAPRLERGTGAGSPTTRAALQRVA